MDSDRQKGHELLTARGHGASRSSATSSGAVRGGSQAPALPQFAELELIEDRQQGVLWEYMAPCGRPSFTLRLLREMKAAQAYLRELTEYEGRCPFRYVVTASRMPGIFNLGGDLPRFVDLIRAGDRDGLLRYARACIAVQWGRASHLGLPIRTISLVQGDALGGGFECALAGDVIIAERGATFALPEILFGLFPGMGAYSFLTRRISPVAAERMLLSGRVYTAEEMHDLGLVDRLIEDGAGESGVYDHIHRERKTWSTQLALQRVRQRVNPVSESELQDITELWVDTALTLGEAELRKMERLAHAQDRRFGSSRAAAEGDPNAATGHPGGP
jgi:DSF synthase